MHWKDTPDGLDAFEKGLHERIMAYEREMLAEEMAAADINAEAIKVAGTVYRRVLRCEGTYMTAAGPVRILRTLYKDRTDEAERAIVPMERVSALWKGVGRRLRHSKPCGWWHR